MRSSEAGLLAAGAAVVVGIEFAVVGLMPAMATVLGIAPAQTGWLVTAFALSSALLGPVVVGYAARLRPGTALGAAMIPFAANLLAPLASSFWMLLVLRALQGAALPLFISLAGAQLAAARGTGRGVALLYVGVTIGGTLGPPLSVFLAQHFGWAMPMVLLGALALGIGSGCFALTRGGPVEESGSPWRLLRRAKVQRHLLLSSLIFATMFTGFSFIALLLGRIGLGANAVAMLLLGFGIAGLAGNSLAGRLERRTLTVTVAVALMVVAATCWVALAGDPPALLIGGVIVLWGAAHSAGFVACQVRVMAATPDAPGTAGSLNISAANVGIAAGSFLGGRALGAGSALQLVMTVSALAALSLGVIAWIALRDRPRPATPV